MTTIRMERNGQVFVVACELCGERFDTADLHPELYGERFDLADMHPELYGDDGQRLGSVCAECFKALQAGGMDGLAERLNTVGDKIRKNGEVLQALAWDLSRGIPESEIRIEAGESLPDDPTAELAELGSQYAAQIQADLQAELETARAKLAELPREGKRLQREAAKLQTLITVLETHPECIPF